MSELITRAKEPIWNFLGLSEQSEESKRKLINRKKRHFRQDASIIPNRERGGDEVDARVRGQGVRKKKKEVAPLAIWKAATGAMGIEKKERKRSSMGTSFQPSALKRAEGRKKEKRTLPDWMKSETFFDDLSEEEVQIRADSQKERRKGTSMVEAPMGKKTGKRDILAALKGKKGKGKDTVDAPMGQRSRMDYQRRVDATELEEMKEFKPGGRGIITVEGPILGQLEERCCECLLCNCSRACAPAEEYDLDNDDQRPFFTYFISFVQSIILICALCIYGFGPIGVDEVKETQLVVKPSLAVEIEERSEFGNLWLGPSQQNLIHLGAKYSPCMRKDPNLAAVLALDRKEERTTGCCVRDDGSGCVQTVPEKCSTLLSTFVKWNVTTSIQGDYKSGAVCGTDPRYCKKPASRKPFEWDKNDFTNWPICEDTNIPGTIQSNCAAMDLDCHMSCELLGRPCCHGIQGECMITTREHCDFKQGFFHEDKFLCSQVNCFEEICGMVPFLYDDQPDQFSRVLSANLLHAGIIHLLISLLFQMIIMRVAEREIGWIRMAIIYLGSGVIGTLASSVLLPYQVEVGPAGAQFGVLACMYVDILNVIINRKVNNDQADNSKLWTTFVMYSVILFILFVVGLLPWLDNWAHIFGFFSGILISLIVMKDVSIEEKGIDRWVVVLVSFILLLLLFILLLICFYVAPITKGSWIQYINCVPITETFCKNMDVAINRGATYSKYI